jgi:hypothetical protein
MGSKDAEIECVVSISVGLKTIEFVVSPLLHDLNLYPAEGIAVRVTAVSEEVLGLI